MGIIRAAIDSIGGGLADSWLEVIEPSEMDMRTVFAPGVSVPQGRNDKRNSNTKGTSNTVSNGSIIHVYEHHMMILVDGGAIVDYTAEPGYFKVDNSSLPSLFNGQFGASVKETFNRIKFGGTTPGVQKVFYINTAEMAGINFGTKTPINYYDGVYDMDLNVRAFGKFSIALTENPLEFYKKVIPTSAVTNNEAVDIGDLINENYIMEFLDALQQALTEISANNVRISQISTRANRDLLKSTISDLLYESWRRDRGIVIGDVGVTVSYDDETKKILTERNKGAMLKDATIREGYVQGSVARGLEAAGSNANGSMAGFMGMGIGMNAGGNFMGAASNNNMQQMQMQQQSQQQAQQQAAYQQQQQQAQPQQPQSEPAPAPAPAPAADGWTCSCGKTGNIGKFCAECGSPKPAPADNGPWTCPECGNQNSGKFCANCGTKKPEKPKKIKCDKCGYEPDMSGPIPKFCPNCGDPINEGDMI